jgi:hypothetical protein
MSSEIPVPVEVENEKPSSMDTFMKGMFETFAEGVVLALKSGNADDATEQHGSLHELIEKIKNDNERKMIKEVVHDVYVSHMTEMQMKMERRITELEGVVKRMKKGRDAVEKFLQMI